MPTARKKPAPPSVWIMALACAIAWLAVPPAPRGEEEVVTFTIVIKDHRFEPAEIRVPAGKRAVINLRNEDPTAEEFDSAELNIEKVIAGGRSGVVRLRPLDPGRYTFVGEYHSDTAKGVVIVE